MLPIYARAEKGSSTFSMPYSPLFVRLKRSYGKKAVLTTEQTENIKRDLVRSRFIGGVYWTKFECISDKIRRILTTNCTCGTRGGSKPLRTPRLRGEVIQCASDTLADSRVQKPKNFLTFFSRLLPPPNQFYLYYWSESLAVTPYSRLNIFCTGTI